MKKVCGYFSYGADNQASDSLKYELGSLRRNDESRYYWISAEFVVDKVVPAKSDSSVLLYYVRRNYQRKNTAAILQSNWGGMQYFKLIQR